MATQMKIQIDKDIPVFAQQHPSRRERKYPLNEMAVGDSFFVAGQKTTGSAASNARTYGKNNRKRFTVRSIEGGIRIWRVA